MKRLLLLFVLAILAAASVGCNNPNRQWNQEQRRDVREALRDYRRMVYLNDLTDAEFGLFAEGVVVDLEAGFPVYTSFIAMPGVQDTVERVIVTTIVQELNTDAHNMRHLYPYAYLVEQGVLPSGLSLAQQREFYQCLAGKVNNYYQTMQQFFAAVLNDTTATSAIAQMQQQCAADLFNWQFTEIDIVTAD